MKKTVKFLPLMLIAMIITSNSISAQDRPEGKMDRFKEEKMKFFNERLELKEAESEKFWPVYEDFHNRMNKVNEDERSLLTYYTNNMEAMNDKEIDETIEKFMALQTSRHELSKTYHAKFVNIIGKKRTMEMYSLEREFRKVILDQFRKGRPEGQSGSGHGRKKGNN